MRLIFAAQNAVRNHAVEESLRANHASFLTSVWKPVDELVYAA